LAIDRQKAVEINHVFFFLLNFNTIEDKICANSGMSPKISLGTWDLTILVGNIRV
jgi:hypothetical protein